MKPVLIDTDILSYFLKGNDKVFMHFQEYLKYHEVISISIITYYEILSGLTFKKATKQIKVFKDFCSDASVINITKESIERSAEIYSTQRAKGEAVDDIDILIAGIALANDFTLITNNTRHFNKIEELRIENWNE